MSEKTEVDFCPLAGLVLLSELKTLTWLNVLNEKKYGLQAAISGHHNRLVSWRKTGGLLQADKQKATAKLIDLVEQQQLHQLQNSFKELPIRAAGELSD